MRTNKKILRFDKRGCLWSLLPEYHKEVVGSKEREALVKNDWEVRKWTLKALHKSACEEKEYEDERGGVFLSF